MPLYDYDCAACGRRFEAFHGVHAPGPTACPLCGGGPVRKALSAPAIHFKGSGWAKKERRASTTKPGKGSTEGGSSGGDDAASSVEGGTPAPSTSSGSATATAGDVD